MHLSSDSALYFNRQSTHTHTSIVGWRVSPDLSKYTHVSLLSINTQPLMKSKPKQSKFSKIYCNLVSSSITDPNGTLYVIGGMNLATKSTL